MYKVYKIYKFREIKLAWHGLRSPPSTARMAVPQLFFWMYFVSSLWYNHQLVLLLKNQVSNRVLKSQVSL